MQIIARPYREQHFAERREDSDSQLEHRFVYDQLVDPETYLSGLRYEEEKKQRTGEERSRPEPQTCGNL